MRRSRVVPTLVDRVVNYVDPVRGLRRAHARNIGASFFDGAGTSGGWGWFGGRKDRRGTSEWRVSSGSADADLIRALPTLRDRSQHLAQNEPIATGAINTVVSNVVGTGLEPQPSIERAILGIADEAADEWQRAALREWWLWSMSQDCDVTRTQNFSGIQDLSLRSVLVRGDVLVLKRYLERNNGFPYGLALQVVEADRLCNPRRVADNTKLDNGHVVVGGVELDKNGAPVAYHVLRQHPGDFGMAKAFEWDRLAAFGAETGERQVWHLFDRKRPDQTRGIPYLAPVIEVLKQVSRYSEAEVAAAVIAACATLFIKTETGEGLDLTATEQETGAKTSDDDIKLAPGLVLNGLPGESLESFNPGRPNAQFDPFMLAMLRQIGAALQIPLELLILHFTSSYSAARAALLQAWKSFHGRRVWFAWNFCQPVYEAVITEAVALGRLSAPGFFEDPLIRQAWCGAEWTGPPAGQIDPESEINAAEKRIALGISTGQRETIELTGGDYESNIKQLGRERRMREEAGLEAPAAEPTPVDEPENGRSREAARMKREREAV